MYSNYACRLADSVVSSNVTLSVAPAVAPSVTIVAHPGPGITAGQPDTLTAYAVNAGSSPSFQWSINGVNVPGATSFRFISSTFASNDSVAVMVTSSGVCSGYTASAAMIIHVFAVGVDQVTNNIDVRLLPNPNKGIFSLKGAIGFTGNQDANIEVTDMLGQIVYRHHALIRNGTVNERIELNKDLANGVYLLRFSAGTEEVIFHFIVER
jgi:hypothetical protein